MAKTAIATQQTIWDCRWSRPGFRLTHVEERFQPESLWVCDRTGRRENVDEARCERCEHWQFDEALELSFQRHIERAK
jgi:hypothetical protein